MSYDLEEMLLLLLSIRKTQSPDFAVNQLSFNKVGSLCSEALKNGWIIEYRKKILLTEQGGLFIEQANDQLGRKGIERYIARLPEVFTEKISLTDIYLPEKI